MDQFLFEESAVNRDLAPPIPMAQHAAFFSDFPKSVILGNSHGLAKVYMENIRNTPRLIDHGNPNHEKPTAHISNLELCRINYILKNGYIIYLQFSYTSGNQTFHGRKYFWASQLDVINQVKKKAKKDKLLKATYAVENQSYDVGNLRFEHGETFVKVTVVADDEIQCMTIETTEGEILRIGEPSKCSPDESLSDWNPAPLKTITKKIAKSGLSFISAGFNSKL